MYVPDPGVTAGSYVSYMCSPYHVWFVAMGYPRLDVLEYGDGEWAIIQYLRDPIIPAETQWQAVLSGMRREPISFGFIKKYVEQLDTQRRAFWDREEAATLAAEQRELDMDRHREDMVARAATAITRNESLMNRIAKNGLQEMNLDRIARHIPRNRL
jgi:hypothetical protein